MASILSTSNPTSSNEFYVPALFKEMFNQISDNIKIEPGESGSFSYDTQSSNVPLLWGIQIVNYQEGDNLSILISSIYGDKYGVFTQDSSVIFEMLEITKSDTINFEIQNKGSSVVDVVVMLSEDPDKSNALSKPDSPFMSIVLPLAISGILLIIGIIILLIGLILYFIDWKNNRIDKRNY